MSDKTGLQLLRDLYPTFEFLNRTGTPQHIMLLGGDSVQAQPGALVRIPSNLVIQMPSFQTFEPISPKLQDYVDACVLKTAPTKATTVQSASVTTSPSSGSKSQSDKKAEQTND
ncbi:hypothetical protein KDA23_03275 [Candidatus Saccharibacteria bacterium]|nr:hypothetical protein [Candidatus Saccharibacteria bacterium]